MNIYPLIKNAVEELHEITKIDLWVYDTQVNVVASTKDATEFNKETIESFIDSPADSQVIGNVHLLKVYDGIDIEYIVVSLGAAEEAHNVGRIAASQLRLLLSANKEKYDRDSFFQSLLMDNLLLVDVHNRATKLHLDINLPRIVYIIESGKENDSMVIELLKGMFSPQAGDFVTVIDENSIILIKALEDDTRVEHLDLIAQSIVDTISAEAMVDVRVGYGTVVNDLKDVSKSYKEAMMVMDVGRIFFAERRVNSYSSLGIGRLIYQLPANLCKMFMDEIFKGTDPGTIDEEILSTVYKFFENSLNVSETSRQLFIHRNTLVYRVEKLKAATGLDVRVFEDALTFRIAMMVYNYLKFQEDVDR